MDKHNSPAGNKSQARLATPMTAFMSLANHANHANRCDWERSLDKVLRQIGFTRYLISLGPTVPRDKAPLAGIITTFPKHWLEHYCCNELIEIDPILKHCRRELVPFFWQRERRRARGRSRDFWRQREQHGLSNGLSIPLRYNLLWGTLSVAFDDVQTTEQEIFSNVAVCQLFMLIPYVLAGLRNQLQEVPQLRQGLTPREIKCLYWASAGKTTWEISRILACSERTVDFHLLNARHKLGAVSRQQAVSTAIACGLITPMTCRDTALPDDGKTVASSGGIRPRDLHHNSLLFPGPSPGQAR